jgi:predicted site-specific integrase-resolvase
MKWLTIAEAAARFAIEAAVVEKLAKDGVIGSKVSPEGQLLVLEDEVKEVAHSLDRRQWEHLRGRPITASDAERHYGLSKNYYARWAREGYVRKLGEDGWRVWLDEADVAYATALAEVSGGLKQGRALFPASPQYATIAKE